MNILRMNSGSEENSKGKDRFFHEKI